MLKNLPTPQTKGGVIQIMNEDGTTQAWMITTEDGRIVALSHELACKIAAPIMQAAGMIPAFQPDWKSQVKQ